MQVNYFMLEFYSYIIVSSFDKGGNDDTFQMDTFQMDTVALIWWDGYHSLIIICSTVLYRTCAISTRSKGLEMVE